MSSPTGPAEQLAGGSFPRSTSSLLILLSDIFILYLVNEPFVLRGKWEGDKRGSQQGIRKVTIKCGGIDCQNRPIETTAHPTLKMRLIPLIDTDKSTANYSNDLWIHNDILSWSKNRPHCAEFRLPNDLLLSMVAKEVYWWVCANDDGLSKASNHKCREEIITDRASHLKPICHKN